MVKIKLNQPLVMAAIFIVSAVGLSSCGGPKNLYSWHKYENASYQHSKKQTEKSEKQFVKEINKVIKKQKGTRKTVPPGIFAEYGFYLYKNGRTEEALSMLNKEIETYPESSVYISRLINQIQK